MNLTSGLCRRCNGKHILRTCLKSVIERDIHLSLLFGYRIDFFFLVYFQCIFVHYLVFHFYNFCICPAKQNIDALILA